MMKPEILVIAMALDLGCRVNDWIRKAFSSKNFADSRMKDQAIFLQLVLGERKLMHCYLARKTFILERKSCLAFWLLSNLQDDVGVARCQEQLVSESSRANLFYQRIQE